MGDNMGNNKITEFTRQDIVDILTSGYYDKKNNKKIQYFWSGRLDETTFLSRLYNLQEIESTDHRFKNAYGDITQHRINNWDWEEDWIFYDPRFGIKNVNDNEFLRFILEIFNPAVRDESKDWEVALDKINEFLKRDGFEIYESDNISGRQIFKYRTYSETKIKLEPPIGKSVNLHLIGEGSYALVYYYKDEFYDKKIVLKRAKKDLSDKELERFKIEFDELKSFKSPYIIDVYSYNCDKKEYTMEYMDFNLYNFIKQNNDKLTMTERKGYVYQIIKAFKYIHSKGRLHRDINPKNILIKIYEDVQVVKISDFGLIKREESTLTTVNTEFKGWFNDPNLRIIGFDKYSMCHEIYALTMTIYYLMTGKTNTAKIEDKNLQEFVKRGMNSDCSKRYKDVEELLKDFRKI